MTTPPRNPPRPGPGQESVWDYPRPPALQPCTASIQIEFGGRRIASTTRSFRVLETSHPPTYYLPISAFDEGTLRPADGASFCEWKGEAAYFDVVSNPDRADTFVAERAAWTYPDPTPRFRDLIDHVAIMAAAMDRCIVDGETVEPQPGGFYGGWITSGIVGPFKGAPGTWGW